MIRSSAHPSRPKSSLRLGLGVATLLALPLVALPLGAQDLKKGPWKRRHIPKGWVMHQSRHYQIQSQVEKSKAVRLANHMEAMLKIYKKLFPPGKPFSGKKYAVKLFKNRQAFVDYCRNPGAAGYYSPTEREMVLYDTGRWMDEKKGAVTGEGAEEGKPDWEAIKRKMSMDILGVAAHEGWHQYFHWYVTSWLQLPSWVNEGMGDYFYTVAPKFKNGKKLPSKMGRLNDARLGTIQRAVKNNKHVPIPEIMKYTQRQYYANPGVCYAQGWAMCHFMLHHPKYKKLVPKFVRRFKNDGNVTKNTKYIFGKTDLAKLEEEWKAWVLVQKDPDSVEEMLKDARKAALENAKRKALEKAKEAAKKEGGGS